MKSVPSQNRHTGPTLLAAIAAATPLATAADEPTRILGGSVAIGSDYVFRGISQTMESPAIQASVDLQFESGLYAYAWGSNVDFVADGDPDDSAGHEIDLAIGYAANIGSAWSMDVALVRYLFPGTAPGFSYDYNELISTLGYGEHYSATIAYTSNVDGTGEESLYYALGAAIELPTATAITINHGYVDLRDAYDANYGYTEVTVAQGISDTTVALAYIDTHGSADAVYYDRLTGPRFVLTLQLDF